MHRLLQLLTGGHVFFEEATTPEEGASGGSPSDSPAQTIIVDGKTLTEADIRELHDKAGMGEDYTKKTMQLAKQREALEQEKAAWEQTRNSQPASPTYSEEEDDEVDPNVRAVVESNSALAKELQTDREARKKAEEAKRAEEFEAQVDQAFNAMEKICEDKGDYPLANPRAVGSRIEAYHKRNNRLPSEDEIRSMAEQEHQFLASRGVVITKKESAGEKSPTASTKASVAGGTGGETSDEPIQRTTPGYRLEDDEIVEDKLKTFLTEQGISE